MAMSRFIAEWSRIGTTCARPQLSDLARYNRWMNDKLYALAATLSDEARKRDGGAFFKSIHGSSDGPLGGRFRR
jgi:hypothetical protein